MPLVIGVPLPSRRLVAALATVLLGSACAPATAGRGGSAIVTASGAARGATVPTAYVESATLSFALDRIDQHRLPLDHTYRHYGSGAGVTVYVFDGGVMANHPELAGRVRRGFDAFAEDGRICNAHGTAVAGAIAGATLGVAPAAEIVDVKMVECRRMRGSIDAIVRGTRWMLADVAAHPGRRAVANWSFIADTAASIPALSDAVQALLGAGIPVVVAAGNLDMNACRIAPGNVPGTIVVGASRVRSTGRPGMLVDERVPGTAFGSCVDVFAPGDSVLLPGMSFGGRAVSQLWAGTSMAAGYVSGAIALYLESHPYATPAEVRQEVRASSAGTLVDAERTPHAGMVYVGTGTAGRR